MLCQRDGRTNERTNERADKVRPIYAYFIYISIYMYIVNMRGSEKAGQRKEGNEASDEFGSSEGERNSQMTRRTVFKRNRSYTNGKIVGEIYGLWKARQGMVL